MCSLKKTNGLRNGRRLTLQETKAVLDTLEQLRDIPCAL